MKNLKRRGSNPAAALSKKRREGEGMKRNMLEKALDKISKPIPIYIKTIKPTGKTPYHIQHYGDKKIYWYKKTRGA